jgi:transcriptional regulator with XRE-family HTH domain
MSIEELREKAGFSMAEMAMYLGISKGRYSLVEYSQRRLPFEAIGKLEALRWII